MLSNFRSAEASFSSEEVAVILSSNCQAWNEFEYDESALSWMRDHGVKVSTAQQSGDNAEVFAGETDEGDLWIVTKLYCEQEASKRAEAQREINENKQSEAKREVGGL